MSGIALVRERKSNGSEGYALRERNGWTGVSVLAIEEIDGIGEKAIRNLAERLKTNVQIKDSWVFTTINASVDVVDGSDMRYASPASYEEVKLFYDLIRRKSR